MSSSDETEPASAAEARIQALMDDAYMFSCDHHEACGAFPGLRLLAARYGKALGRAGTSLKEALREDPRFTLKMKPEGRAYVVEVIGTSPYAQKVLRAIKRAPEGVMSHAEILGLFKGSGLKVFEAMDIIDPLVEAGLLKRDKTVYTRGIV